MVGSKQPDIALTFSSGIQRIPGLGALLGVDRVVRRPLPELSSRFTARPHMLVGWGNKPNTARARRFAAREGLPFLALEDGFLRSLDLGVNGEPPLSLVVDDLGIYYDASKPSRLERILESRPGDPELLERAEKCLLRIRQARLSKYNLAPEQDLPPSDRPRILVIDQTAGDRSISGALADADSFRRMLLAAREEHPEAELLIKIHPDVCSGKRQGH